MPTIQDLRERRTEVVAELRAINDAAKLGKRPWTEDERARVGALRTEAEQITHQLDAVAEQESQEAWLEEQEAKLKLSTGRKTDVVQVADQLARDVTTTAATTHLDQNLAHYVLSTTGETVSRPKFATFGEQLQAIATASRLGPQHRDPRLVYDRIPSYLAPSISGASETVPSDGGFLVQKEFSTELIKRTYQFGELLQRIRMIPIGDNANGLKMNAVDETSRATGSRWGGVQMYWQAEADSPTSKKPKFRQMEWNLKKLIGLAYATDELLQDAAALEAVFMQAFSEETAFMVENGVYNGPGAGQPLGFLNSGSLISVAKETGQATKTVVKENIDKMWARMWGRSWANSVWFINQDVIPQLQGLAQVIGTAGAPMYQPPGNMSAAPYSTLYGRPVIPVEYAQTVGTAGDIVLVDLSQYLGIDKGRMQTASSIHVRFINDENTFRFVYRFDGQPLWYTTLTPFNGTNSYSPFIALAAR